MNVLNRIREKRAEEPDGSGRIWSAAFINIFVVNFVMSMGQNMMSTLVPKYAYQLGGEATIVGVVAGVFAVTALGVRPIAGPAMDYFKRNRLLSLSVCGDHAVLRLLRLCDEHPVDDRVAPPPRPRYGFTAPLSLAIVSTILPSGKMASGLGVFSLGGAVAMAFGPALGLSMAAAISYNTTFFVCAGVMFCCFLLSLKLRDDSPARVGKFRISITKIVAPEVLLPTVVLFFQIIAYSGVTSFVAIYGGLCGVDNIGLFFTANALCMIGIRPFTGYIADKFGVDKTIIPGLAIFIAALVLISFSRTLPMFLLSGIVTAIGFGSSEPIIQTLNMQLVPKERRGAAGNTNFMGIDIGFLIGPTIAGFIISSVQHGTGQELLGYSVMYRVMIIPTVAAIVIFGLSRKKLRARIKALQPAAGETAKE